MTRIVKPGKRTEILISSVEDHVKICSDKSLNSLDGMEDPVKTNALILSMEDPIKTNA